MAFAGPYLPPGSDWSLTGYISVSCRVMSRNVAHYGSYMDPLVNELSLLVCYEREYVKTRVG
jgi:hypothetical protein